MFADFDKTLFRLSVAGTLYGFALCAGPKAHAAPITFNTALPISAGEVILREQFVFAGASSEDVDIDSFTALTVGGYGITPKWSVFGVLPVTHIEIEFEGNRSDVFGLGDAVLFSRYEILRIDKRGATSGWHRFSVFGCQRVKMAKRVMGP